MVSLQKCFAYSEHFLKRCVFFFEYFICSLFWVVDNILGLARVELGRFGGLGDFRAALGSVCQKSKPFPICASPSPHSPTLSVPPSITTSAFPLLTSYTQNPEYPTYLPPNTPRSSSQTGQRGCLCCQVKVHIQHQQKFEI